MNTFEPKYVNQSKAATLLGMTKKNSAEFPGKRLRPQKSGWMHEEYFFTVEELRNLCELTTQTVIKRVPLAPSGCTPTGAAPSARVFFFCAIFLDG